MLDRLKIQNMPSLFFLPNNIPKKGNEENNRRLRLKVGESRKHELSPVPETFEWILPHLVW